MFRFTIRDLLWLMALCAVLLAWWIDHQATRLIAERVHNAFHEQELRLLGEEIESLRKRLAEEGK